MTREADIAGNLYDDGAELERENKQLRAYLNRALDALMSDRRALMLVAPLVYGEVLGEINRAIAINFVALRDAGRSVALSAAQGEEK